MAVRGDGLAEEDGAQGALAEASTSASAAEPLPKVVYVLHPNCAIEEV